MKSWGVETQSRVFLAGPLARCGQGLECAVINAISFSGWHSITIHSMISLSYPVPLPPPRLLARIEQSGHSANWCRFALNPWHQMCQIYATATGWDLSEKCLQLLIKSSYLVTTHKLNTDSQGFWVGANPKSLEVIVYLRSKIFRQLRWGEDFYIDLLYRSTSKDLLYWLARSTGKDGHKPDGQVARSPGCTVVMEGFYSGPGDIFHAWPTHALLLVKTRRLEWKTAHEKSQTLVFYTACSEVGCALNCCNII